MKTVFMGTPEFAAESLKALIESEHQVLAVVTQPDKPSGRGHKLTPPPVKVVALENDIPVYEYLFSKTNGRLGPWHSGEEVYLYGNIPDNSDLYTSDDRHLSGFMSGYFASFARDGDPNGTDLPEWRETSGSQELMEFGDHIGMIEEKHLALYEILDRMYGWK